MPPQSGPRTGPPKTSKRFPTAASAPPPHEAHNRLGASSYDDAPPRRNGLSPFGETVITKLNRLGMMGDLFDGTDPTGPRLLNTPSCLKDLRERFPPRTT